MYGEGEKHVRGKKERELVKSTKKKEGWASVMQKKSWGKKEYLTGKVMKHGGGKE